MMNGHRNGAPGGLVAAQTDGEAPRFIVSALREGTANVSLSKVRFEKGARVTGNSPDIWVSFNLTGSSDKICDWSLAGTRFSHFAPRGALYVCPAGLDFRVETDVAVDVLEMSVPNETAALALGDSYTGDVYLIERAGTIDLTLLALAQALISEAEGGYQNGPQHWLDLSDRIVLHLVDQHTSSSHRKIGGTLSEASLQRVKDLINDTLAESISLDDLARAAGQSRFHFQRTFTRALGISPYRYLMRRRLQAAVNLLRTSHISLAEIALDTGFADQSHLSRWCRAVYGMSLTRLHARH
jgi:AraC family transcriptional regulator